MQPIRIGYVKYFNTVPLVEGLSAWRDVQLIEAAPSALADMLRRGEVDLALASLVDGVRDDAITLVPCGMIGCDGPTLTVRLFSRIPFDQVTDLWCDTDSHTSVILAQVILARAHNRRVKVHDYDAAAHTAPDSPGSLPPTLLIIGDKVVTDAPQADAYPHQLDLGEAWKRLTDLPFMYATWMCRRADLTDDAPLRQSLLSAAALLDRQRRRNLLRTDWLIDRSAARKGWPRDLAERYVKEFLLYEADDRAIAGAERFLAEAAHLGLLPSIRPHWLAAPHRAAVAAAH